MKKIVLNSEAGLSHAQEVKIPGIDFEGIAVRLEKCEDIDGIRSAAEEMASADTYLSSEEAFLRLMTELTASG